MISATMISMISTITSTPTTHPLPVRQFPAFGNNSNDCSVRFSSTKHEQTGYWTCAARVSTSDPFTSTEPAKLSIVNANHGRMLKFLNSISQISLFNIFSDYHIFIPLVQNREKTFNIFNKYLLY